MHPREWTELRPQGLYVQPADAYIDPLRPVETAVVTHGHSDHARAGHGTVIATPETLAIMECRYGRNFCGQRVALPCGEALERGDAEIRLHPAGHVLGSAQVEVRHAGGRLVVSGDYRDGTDNPTCAPFTPVPCDLFITEATFALPVFKQPDAAAEIAKLLTSLGQSPGRCHLVGAYALGKAQRVMATLRQCGYDRTLYLHGAIVPLTRLYESLGIDFGRWQPVSGVRDTATLAGEIVICPPGALADRWARKLPDPLPAMASGWMQIRARARQRGVELPLLVSDHCDWNGLTRCIEATGASEIWITHGRDDALGLWAKKQGLEARALEMAHYEEEHGD